MSVSAPKQTVVPTSLHHRAARAHPTGHAEPADERADAVIETIRAKLEQKAQSSELRPLIDQLKESASRISAVVAHGDEPQVEPKIPHGRAESIRNAAGRSRGAKNFSGKAGGSRHAQDDDIIDVEVA